MFKTLIKRYLTQLDDNELESIALLIIRRLHDRGNDGRVVSIRNYSTNIKHIKRVMYRA